MSRFIFSEDNAPQRVYVPVQQKRHYGIFRFLFDVVLVTITSGLWLIWIFVREMRKRKEWA